MVAVTLQPLRERLRRRAHWLRHGDRSDPLRTVHQLGRRLDEAVDPTAVLPRLPQAVSEALGVPYAAIELTRCGGQRRLVACCGRRLVEPEPEAFLITHEGREVGRLLVTPRSPYTPFTAAERSLLEDLACRAGLAAHRMGLAVDLQRSRRRLVDAREEERRRLHRDLYDGLGPTLAGMTLQVGAARAMLTAGTAEAADVLEGLEQGLQTCVLEIRRLVNDLRPPALDRLGLVAGIRQRVSAFAFRQGSAPRVSVCAPDDLGELPAAVEVAAFLIATEAVTNVIRHAMASRCDVDIRLEAPDWLVVEVVDDGVALPDGHQAGGGWALMRERAEELGGVFLFERLPHGGSRIRAELPVAAR
jgi:signal transduction histidine kinase